MGPWTLEEGVKRAEVKYGGQCSTEQLLHK